MALIEFNCSLTPGLKSERARSSRTLQASLQMNATFPFSLCYPQNRTCLVVFVYFVDIFPSKSLLVWLFRSRLLWV